MGAKIFQWGKNSFFLTNAGKNEYPMQKSEVQPLPYSIHKN